MKKTVIALGAAVALMLTGCSPAAPNPSKTDVQSIPTPVAETPSPTPAEEAGSRGNPLTPGVMRALTESSAWTVGADAATVRGKGYIVLPLHVDIDWDAVTAQGGDGENDGIDIAGSLRITFVTAGGRSYEDFDYEADVKNDLYDLGIVYSPTTSVSANYAVNVPDGDVEGGLWRIENVDGDAVWIALD